MVNIGLVNIVLVNIGLVNIGLVNIGWSFFPTIHLGKDNKPILEMLREKNNTIVRPWKMFRNQVAKIYSLLGTHVMLCMEIFSELFLEFIWPGLYDNWSEKEERKYFYYVDFYKKKKSVSLLSFYLSCVLSLSLSLSLSSEVSHQVFVRYDRFVLTFRIPHNE